MRDSVNEIAWMWGGGGGRELLMVNVCKFIT